MTGQRYFNCVKCWKGRQQACTIRRFTDYCPQTTTRNRTPFILKILHQTPLQWILNPGEDIAGRSENS
jgi:hypothetical protein